MSSPFTCRGFSPPDGSAHEPTEMYLVGERMDHKAGKRVYECPECGAEGIIYP